MPSKYNFVIIGAGPAGAEAALLASKNHHAVALIEKDKWGGTCLYEGCIPTKTLLHLTKTGYDGDLRGLFARVFEKVTAISASLKDNLARAGVTLFEGEAKIVDEHTVTVDGVMLMAERIIYAGGSEPIKLPIPGSGLDRIYDSHTVYEMSEVPSQLAIVGGGYIGFEWAEIFYRLGSTVTIYEAQPQVLTALDEDVRRRLLGTLRGKPVSVKTNEAIAAFEPNAGRISVLTKTAKADYDAVFIAVGRRPSRLATPNGVSKIGDALGAPLLAHKAGADARRLFDPHEEPSLIPSVIYTTPEVAIVGLSEQEAKAKPLSYKTYKLPYRANSKAFVTDADEGFVKLIVDDGGQFLLGAAIIGQEAGDIINVLTLAIQERIPIAKLKRLVFPHPTIGELIGQALALIEEKNG